MDAAQEARCNEMLDQILAMAKKMALDLEACNAALQAACPPSSPPSTSILTADTEEREASTSMISTKPATTSSASLIPSPTSAPPQDADPSFQSGVSEVSTEGELCILFDADADGGGVDHLSRLPDSLLRDIVSRLPLKDASRTVVLSHRWSPVWRAAPLVVIYDDDARNDVLHLNRLHVLHELDLNKNRLVGTTDQERLACWSTISTNSKAETAFPASPTPSSPSATPWGADPEVFFIFHENAVATHVRCSTLGLYRVVTTLMPANTSSASPMSTSTTTSLARATITKHLLATSPTSIDHRQGNKIPKPPWLLGTEVSHSWSGRMQLISGFLLEVSPWCSDYTLWVRWQPSLPSNGMLLRTALWPLFNPDYARVQTAVALSLWMEEVLELKPPWPPPEQKLIMLQPCISCGLGWPNTGSSCLEACWEIHMYKLQWLQFLQSAALVDEGNRSGALSIFCQLWLFTKIPVAGMSLLLNVEFYLLTYFWMKYQISFPDPSPSQEKYRVISSRLYKPSALAALMLVMSSTHPVLYKLLSGVSWEFEPWPYIQISCMHLVSSYAFLLEENYAQPDLKECNTTHGHCNLLTYAIGCMVLATKMVSGGIKNGWLIAQVNIWLLWDKMGAYQLYSPTGVQFMLVWLLSYKENVVLNYVAGCRCLIVYRNDCSVAYMGSKSRMIDLSKFWIQFQAVLGNKIYQNLLAEGTQCMLVFQIDVQLPKIQIIAKYQQGLVMSRVCNLASSEFVVDVAEMAWVQTVEEQKLCHPALRATAQASLPETWRLAIHSSSEDYEMVHCNNLFLGKDFLVQWDSCGFEALHFYNFIGLGAYDIAMNNYYTGASLLMDLNIHIISVVHVATFFTKLKERMMVLQLFAFSGIPCSILQVVPASQSEVPWDPGISKVLQISNITMHGLGTSRIFRRGECHDPTGDTMGRAAERMYGLDQDQGKAMSGHVFGPAGRKESINHEHHHQEERSKDQNRTRTTAGCGSRRALLDSTPSPSSPFPNLYPDTSSSF